LRILRPRSRARRLERIAVYQAAAASLDALAGPAGRPRPSARSARRRPGVKSLAPRRLEHGSDTQIFVAGSAPQYQLEHVPTNSSCEAGSPEASGSKRGSSERTDDHAARKSTARSGTCRARHERRFASPLARLIDRRSLSSAPGARNAFAGSSDRATLEEGHREGKFRDFLRGAPEPIDIGKKYALDRLAAVRLPYIFLLARSSLNRPMCPARCGGGLAGESKIFWLSPG
jgi:hypothetical protein